MNLPNSYRITKDDVNKAWSLLGSYFLNHDEWTEQHELATVITDGACIRNQTGKWPTIGDVIAQREEREKEEGK